MEAPKRRRTTTGCLTCRIRRKKCDEEKPTCLGCRRNRLMCNWTNDRVSASVVALSRLPIRKRPAIFKATNRVSLQTELPERGQLKYPLICPVACVPDLTRPRDVHLFDHYMRVTAVQLAGRTEPKNPFLSHLIPAACSEPTVLRCILAVSGAQLSIHSAEYERETRSHYAVALRSVKHNLVNWRESNTSVLVSLLISTIMLGFFEVVIGDTHANFQFHLRASRTLLYELRMKRANEVDKCMLDLLTELYAFFAITSNITLHAGLTPERTIPQDSFLSSEVLITLNQGSDFYGILFGAAHELFALINPISNTARHFLADINQEARFKQITKYENWIKQWSYTANTFVPSDPDVADPYALAARAYQQAILIFLYTMFHGASPPTADLYAKVDECVLMTFHALGSLPPYSHIRTTIMWPVLIAGSCLRDLDLRKAVLVGLQDSVYTTASAMRGAEFLTLLWKEMDQDASVYGPWGIEKVMIMYGIDICCA